MNSIIHKANLDSKALEATSKDNENLKAMYDQVSKEKKPLMNENSELNKEIKTSSCLTPKH